MAVSPTEVDVAVIGAGPAGSAAAITLAKAGARVALMVTLGTGIGGGLIVDGRIYRGANSFAAEFGHVTVVRSGPICACSELGH